MRFDEVTRRDLVSKVRSQDKQRYNKRLGYRPATFDGINIRELFTNDILIFTTKVGDYDNIIAVDGVLTKLKSMIHDKGKCTYADVLKAVNQCLDKDGIKIRCTCSDYLYRYMYWAYKGGYLYGDPGRAAEFPEKTNPNGRGSMCKHLASTLSRKEWLVKVAQALNNYIRLNRDICAPYLFDKDKQDDEPDVPKDDSTSVDNDKTTDDTKNNDTDLDKSVDDKDNPDKNDDTPDEFDDQGVGLHDDQAPEDPDEEEPK